MATIGARMLSLHSKDRSKDQDLEAILYHVYTISIPSLYQLYMTKGDPREEQGGTKK